MGLDSLLNILKKVQTDYPRFSKRLAEAEALSRWESVVGPQIAKHTRVIRVQDKTLMVEVDHSIWKSELMHRKRQILDLLNQAGDPSGKEAIEEIHFVDPRGSAPSVGATSVKAKKSQSPQT